MIIAIISYNLKQYILIRGTRNLGKTRYHLPYPLILQDFPRDTALQLSKMSLTVTDAGGSSDTATITAAGPDRDIVQFSVTKKIRPARLKRIAIKLVVKSDGLVYAATRPATVIGTQNRVQVYNQAMMVSDPVGNGRNRFSVPPYTLKAAGDIRWSAAVADPYVDEATATTHVE